MVENSEPDIEMDLEDNRLAQSPQAKRLEFDDNESQDHTLKY